MEWSNLAKMSTREYDLFEPVIWKEARYVLMI